MRAGCAGVILMLCACGRLGFDHGAEPDARAVIETSIDATAAEDGEGYRATAVTFEPTGNDHLWAGSLLNTTSSGRGTFSAWFRFNAGDNQQQLIAVTQIVGFGGVMRQANNRFRFIMPNCLGVPVVDMASQGSYTTASGWVHVLASWDSGMGRADLYINDVADRANPIIVAGPICYDTIRWGIAGWVSGQLDAHVADFYSALGTYFDLSVEANRRRFRDAAGKPVDLGPACAGPTGAPSTVCFAGDAATWSMNEGVAQGFNLEGDGLAAALTSPSD